MLIEEEKFENYWSLSRVLGEITERYLSADTVRGLRHLSDHMDDRIGVDSKTEFLLKRAVESYPKYAYAEGDHFVLTMIASEAVNEEDPVKDKLTIKCIGDIFWAKKLVDDALYHLLVTKWKESNGF